MLDDESVAMRDSPRTGIVEQPQRLMGSASPSRDEKPHGRGKRGCDRRASRSSSSSSNSSSSERLEAPVKADSREDGAKTVRGARGVSGKRQRYLWSPSAPAGRAADAATPWSEVERDDEMQANWQLEADLQICDKTQPQAL
ncbi:hypothetical protein PSPO01_02099 [Paraphaeosphaeria sporulosa]